ncbi:MAG: hypothetical protein GY719_29845, partial [bacterium]|nr:hypothetical protein [bacterium]
MKRHNCSLERARVLPWIILVTLVALAPATVAGLEIVAAGSELYSDKVNICSDASGSWTCSEEALPGVAPRTIRGHQTRFMGWDANQDGDSGFVAWGKYNYFCERISGSWSCHEFAPANQVFKTDVFDYDQDGFDDLVFYKWQAGPQYCRGNTWPAQCIPIPGGHVINHPSYTGLAWADYNGDGNLDVYVSYNKPWQTGTSKLCLGTGGGFNCANFTGLDPAARSYNTDAQAFYANDDPHMDLYIEANPIYGARDVSGVCLNDGNANFTCTPTTLPDIHIQGSPWGVGTSDLHAIDMDLDGNEDLVTASRADPIVCWNQYHAGGTLDCRFLDGSVSAQMRGPVLSQATVADIDGDDYPDVMYGLGNSPSGVRVCTNLGNRSFECVDHAQGGGINVGFLGAGGGGPEGQAGTMHFDGTGKVLVGDVDALDGLEVFTGEAWVKFDSGADFQRVFSKVMTDNKNGFDLLTYQGRIDFNPMNDANVGVHTSPGTLQTDTWMHIAVVYDGTKTGNLERAKIYL